MTYDETLVILAALKAAYPHSFKGMKRGDGEAMVKLWQLQFAAEPVENVTAAINALISTRTVGYSPTIGEVKGKLQSLQAANNLSEQEAWALVSKACRNGYYGYLEEFAKLPPEVQRAVGRAEQLRDWAVMDEDTFQSVIGSNFQRNYRATQAREKEMAMLPASVREFIAGVSRAMLPEGQAENAATGE